MERDDGEQRGRQHWTDDAFEVVGKPGERQCPRVLLLLRKNVGDGRLKRRRKGRRRGLKHEDQCIDLPDFGHERQQDCHPGAHEVEGDKHRPSRQALREGGGDRRDAHIGDHLDCQSSAEHGSRLRARELEGEQAERNRQQPGTHKRNDLREEQMAVGAVCENVQQEGDPSIMRRRKTPLKVLGDFLELVDGAAAVPG